MSRHTTGQTPIDFFVWKKEDERKDKLVYYDQEGTCFERSVDHDTLDNALKIFSGRVRAVRRSSGGLVMAEPLQIVVYEGGIQESPLHIRVRFRELVPTSAGEEKTSMSCTKVVAASELFEPFLYDFDGSRKQTFALDFGQGIVPVYPFYYHQTDSETEAYFLDARDWDNALRGSSRDKARVQIYRVTRSALRWTGPAVDGTSAAIPVEAERARRNFEKLKEANKTIVPETFRFGGTIEVPCGGSAQDIRHFLRICVQKRIMGKPVYLNVRAKEDELLPFGMFEEG